MIEVFDVQGRRAAEIVRSALGPGTYSITWDGRDSNGHGLANGIYFLRARVGASFQEVRKIALLR
jgi:hypothetical protein